MSDSDSIAAVATPPGEGAIGIVRVSGDRCGYLTTRLFQRSGRDRTIESHRLHYGYIVDPNTGERVDEVLLALMRAPRTYTREDVLEIQCHSGKAVLERILGLVLDSGVRPAEPGEFTKRAFLNGRLDLARAEAVIDVVKAQTREALAVSSNQLQGVLSEKLEFLRVHLADLKARVEVAIDFPEDDVEILAPEEAILVLEGTVLPQLVRLMESFEAGRLLREGIKVVIAGRPNVGKSSLLNALLQQNRAIVTPYPGTTRDSVEEVISLSGIPMRIIDTAGLRETDDEIERVSLETTKDRIQRADLALFVVDYSENLMPEDQSVFQQIQGKPSILVANKQDIWKGASLDPLKWVFQGHRIVPVSALERTGLDELKKAMVEEFVRPGLEPGSQIMLTRFRHKEALEQCSKHVVEAAANLKQGGGLDMLAADIGWALKALDMLTGETTPEEVLDRIFSQFCIGK